MLFLGVSLAQERCERYQRDDYEHWIDADWDGENTRREVLIRSNLDSSVYRNGRWKDPYSGIIYHDPQQIQIDHVVALSEAHQSGAWGWTLDQKRAFANDLAYPEQLLAVYGPLNEGKSDKDPAEWLPPDNSKWKWYARLWIAIKLRWGLTIDEDEQASLRKILAEESDRIEWPNIAPEYRCNKDGTLQQPRKHRLQLQMEQRQESERGRGDSCCKTCKKGKSKACGDRCIGLQQQCHHTQGCACNERAN